MTTSLATTTPTPPVIDQAAVLRALRLDPKDPNTQALVLTCGRYGLDPLLKHAVLIQGTLYVTRDGLMHVAHASGRFDGISVRSLPDTPTHYVAEATVWRKDMGHPFVYTGRYPKGGKGGPGAQYGPEMAEKCAECRALRRAFSVALCSREELFDQDDAPAPNVDENSKLAAEARSHAVRAFWQDADKCGLDVRTNGKVDPEKVAKLAAKILGRDPDRDATLMRQGMNYAEACARLDDPATLESLIGTPAGVGDILTAEVVADIGDPFAEAEPGELLSVEAHDPKGRI